jgi:hypothetical protein
MASQITNSRMHQLKTDRLFQNCLSNIWIDDCVLNKTFGIDLNNITAVPVAGLDYFKVAYCLSEKQLAGGIS